MSTPHRVGWVKWGWPPSRTSWLSHADISTLEACCNALIPSVQPPGEREDCYGLYARSAQDLHVAQRMVEMLAQEPQSTRDQLKRMLRVLRNPLFCAALCGSCKSFARLPAAQQVRLLRKMSLSSLPLLRQAFQALKRLSTFLFYAQCTENGSNPNWPAIHYIPKNKNKTYHTEFSSLIRPYSVERDVCLRADVVVVGSGAGGSVVAAELTKAGKEVILLEKGGYYSEEDFTGREGEMTSRLYSRHGLLATSNHGVLVVAGSCLGGGTVVNWCTSLRTPPSVLEEWERVHGLVGVSQAEYQRAFELIERRLGVAVNQTVNANNAALRRGCAALGYRWDYLPRNASQCEERCGSCIYGCPYGCKQSTVRTFLQDACAGGVRVLVNCEVEQILIEQGRASGVIGWAAHKQTGTRFQVRVQAPVVVVAGGAIESPALLLRSGLDNAHIGRHLHLHPVTMLFARYREPIETWKGSLQTIFSDQLAYLQGSPGIRLEVAPLHAGLYALLLSWESGVSHKHLMEQIAHYAAFVVLTHDSSEGSVTLDREGHPLLHYWPNSHDRDHLLSGMQAGTRVALAGGAIGVETLFTPRLALQNPSCVPEAPSPRQVESFLQSIRDRGVHPNRLLLLSAHQMGTCRFGSSPRSAVANPYGEVYGTPGLFLADASGFPTAVGVNPMLSVMALAYRVAQYIKSA